MRGESEIQQELSALRRILDDCQSNSEEFAWAWGGVWALAWAFSGEQPEPLTEFVRRKRVKAEKKGEE